MQRRKSLRFLTQSAIMAALLAILAPWTLPIGPVPVTLATLVLFLVAACTPLSISLTATAVYLGLGALGLPVFAGFSGGLGVLVSATGGFLWSYLPAAALVSLAARAKRRVRLLLPLGMVGATAIVYMVGGFWFSVVTDCTLYEAMASAVLPFLLPDALKIVVASWIALTVRGRLAASKR